MNKSMNRRRFVTSLGATTLLPAVYGAVTHAEPQEGTSRDNRSRIDLNGHWERRINGELFDVIAVPSSQRPVGLYRLKRTFILPRLRRGECA